MERGVGQVERRAQILGAALRVFSERGFAGASIRRISDEAGLNSPPLVYWYFRSKRDLFEAVLAEHAARVPGSLLSERMEEPPEEVLPALAREELGSYGDPRLARLLRMAVAEAALEPAGCQRFFAALRAEELRSLERYLETWSERRGAAGVDPASEARVLFGALFFHVLNREVLPGFGGELPGDEAYAEAVVRPVLRRLAPAETAGDPPAVLPSRVPDRAEVGEPPATIAAPADAGVFPGEPEGEAVRTSPGASGDPTADGASRRDEAGEEAGEPAGPTEADGVRGRPSSGVPGGPTRERPRLASPPETPPALPPRLEIPLFDPASSRAERAWRRREPDRETGETAVARGGEAGASEPSPLEETPPAGGPEGASDAARASRPFPAEPPDEVGEGGFGGVGRGVEEDRGGVRKVLFFVLPVRGHVQAALPVAQELASRGEEVVFYSTEEFEGLVRGAGVGFRALEAELTPPPELSEGYLGVPRSGRPAVLRSIADALRGARQLAGWAEEEDADYAVYDPICPWGRLVPEALGLPAVALYTTFVAQENSPLARRLLPSLDGTPPPALVMPMVRLRWELREARSALGLPRLRPADLLLQPGEMNVVTLPERFQPPTGGTIDERFLFVGPSILQRDERAYFSLEQIEARPTVFVSLGPAYDEWTADLYRECLEAFASSRWLVVMETGPGTDPSLLGQAPANAVVWPRVPRLEVLRRCDIFVTDGDVGATMEALWFGVPLVVVPRNPEQEVVAERVEELAMGVVLDRRSADGLAVRQAVDGIGADPSYHSGLADLWVAARQSGGSRLAADGIQAFVRRSLAAGR